MAFCLTQKPITHGLQARPLKSSCHYHRSVRRGVQDSEKRPEVAASPAPADEPLIRREFSSLGSKVIETNQSLAGPENEPDFWEGDKFEWLGTGLAKWFVPMVIVLGLAIGGIAARSYNEGADVLIKPASEEAGLEFVRATPSSLGGDSSP